MTTYPLKVKLYGYVDEATQAIQWAYHAEIGTIVQVYTYAIFQIREKYFLVIVFAGEMLSKALGRC